MNILQIVVTDELKNLTRETLAKWVNLGIRTLEIVAGGGSGDAKSGVIKIDTTKTVKTNDIKKGAEVFMSSLWFGVMADNMRGNTRVVNVFGFSEEAGSVYSHNILLVKDAEVDVWYRVDHTDSQIKLKERVEGMW